MEDFKKKNGADVNDKEIVFSQSIKAGKRIYYLDVKKNRKDEMFLAITESKKVVMGEGDDSQVSFEKHKIFLYKEDFEKFMNGLQQAIGFIQEQQGCYARQAAEEGAESPEAPQENLLKEEEKDSPLDGEIKIDIEF
ncbi:PUR family DNA/RNA-binding protein [Bacteroides sp.]|uniref:PUR family DNA/RNA-binding protein n=1 Tax=Bacteroides sp. TaxID=29523 RepID=UPI003AB45049